MDSKILQKSDNADKVKSEAISAYKFYKKTMGGYKFVGGNKLKHKPTSHGVAIKWLIYKKKMTYKEFAYLYNGTTAQNANHLINRIRKDRYFDSELSKMCKVLGVSLNYLHELSDEIEVLMEGVVDEASSR